MVAKHHGRKIIQEFFQGKIHTIIQEKVQGKLPA
jgi:hypothetical protein